MTPPASDVSIRKIDLFAAHPSTMLMLSHLVTTSPWNIRLKLISEIDASPAVQSKPLRRILQSRYYEAAVEAHEHKHYSEMDS
jgi:hypothetical protein